MLYVNIPVAMTRFSSHSRDLYRTRVLAAIYTFSTAVTVYMVGSCMQVIKQQAEKSDLRSVSSRIGVASSLQRFTYPSIMFHSVGLLLDLDEVETGSPVQQ